MRKNILMANNNLFIGYRFTHGLRNGSGNFTSPYLNLINGLNKKYSTIQDKSPGEIKDYSVGNVVQRNQFIDSYQKYNTKYTNCSPVN